MAKLFVFGIGGTGSRVIRSLTMLLASGIKLPGEFDTIVPIIIDPDSANGDMNRATDLLIKYQAIREKVGSGAGFFETQIKTLPQLSNENKVASSENFTLKIDGVFNERFSDFIGYSGMDNSASQDLIDLLYDEDELNSNMDVGFKGKPNIGSIVLNDLIKSSSYKEFVNKFDKGDAIFIISSIFGGTGAAGFPLLLKNLRQEDPNIPGADLVSNSKIGAISFLPYFKITPPEDDSKAEIDSSTFFGKAKAALGYYEHAIFKKNSLNSFYYLADFSQNNYEHNTGKAEQQNNAHFLELGGALAILDFLKDTRKLETSNKRAVDPVFKEFGVSNGTRELNFSDLGVNTRSILVKQLSAFNLMQKFLDTSLKDNLNSRAVWVTKGGLSNDDFFETEFYTRYLNGSDDSFFKAFAIWLEELKSNDVSFQPYSSKNGGSDLLNFIKGHKVKNTLLKRNRADSKYLSEQLSKDCMDLLTEEPKVRRFIKLFSTSTLKKVEEVLKD
jgi:hypothetical protein